MTAAEQIRDRLLRCEAENDFVIIYEGCVGSRLIGTYCLESDYDVRFVYVRPISQYLTTASAVKKTVSFREILGDGTGIDAQGYDVSHMINLLSKGNVMMTEVMMSWLQFGVHPIMFGDARQRLIDLATEPGKYASLAMHCLSIASGAIQKMKEEPRIDHYLHAVRYILAAERIVHSLPWTSKTLPMILDRLYCTVGFGCLMPPECRDAVQKLIVSKTVTKQLTRRIEVIDDFVASAIPKLLAAASCLPKSVETPQHQCDALFHRILGDVWGSWRPISYSKDVKPAGC